MKKLILIIIITTAIIPACKNSSQKFEPNTNNPLMVGSWTITNVDNSGDLLSKQTFFLSLIEEEYVDGNLLVFSPGSKFTVLSVKGDTLDVGKYGISDKNKNLDLYSPRDKKLIRYKILTLDTGTIQLEPLTPGVTRSLTMQKGN